MHLMQSVVFFRCAIVVPPYVFINMEVQLLENGFENVRFLDLERVVNGSCCYSLIVPAL